MCLESHSPCREKFKPGFLKMAGPPALLSYQDSISTGLWLFLLECLECSFSLAWPCLSSAMRLIFHHVLPKLNNPQGSNLAECSKSLKDVHALCSMIPHVRIKPKEIIINMEEDYSTKLIPA